MKIVEEILNMLFLLVDFDAIMADTDSEPELSVVGGKDKNVNTEIVDTERPVENIQIEKDSVHKVKRGPPVHPIWSYAFDDPTVYSTTKPNNAICKQSVRHYHKTLSVKNHLKKCQV